VRKVFGYSSEFSIFAIVGLVLIAGPLNFGSRPIEAQCLLHIATIVLLPLWMIRLVCLVEPFFIWTRVTLPALAFVGYVLAWYLVSDVRWLARQEFLMLLSYLTLFLVVVNNLQRRWQLQALFWIIAAVAAAQAADGIFRHYHGSMGVACRFFFLDCVPRQGAQNLTRAGGTFYTPDHFAAYLEIGLVLIAAHLVILKRSWTRKVFLAYLVACVLFGIALSRSRGGWITILCVVPFLVLLVARGRFLNFRSGLVGVLVLAAVLVLLYRQHGFVADRLQDLLTEGEPKRLKFYHAALEIGRDNPVFGVGPRLFNLHFRQHYFLTDEPEFVHNEYLQVLADYGVVGAVLVGWLLFAFYRSAFRMCALKEDEHSTNVSKDVSQRLALAIGGTAAAFAITIHSLFDFVMHVMGIGVTLTVVAALAYSAAALRRKRSETELDRFGFDQAHRSTSLSPRQLNALLASLAVAFLLAFPVALRNYLSIRFELEAEALAYAAEWNDPDAALELYHRAVATDARSYHAAYALASFYFAHGGADPEIDASRFELTLRWYREAIRLNPYFLYAREALARIYAQRHQADEARAQFEAMVGISPFHPNYWILYGEACLIGADYEAAREKFRHSLPLIPENEPEMRRQAETYLTLLEGVPRPSDPDYE
jgi:tetratricopeptide (TPR) repeat protein